MHPTRIPDRQPNGSVHGTPFTPTREQLARAHADLAVITDPEVRTTYALGYLDSVLHDAARHADNRATLDAIARGLAVLTELDTIDRQQSRFAYDREDPVDPNFVNPPWVDGFSVGRAVKH